jgi:hypothetical protein
MNILLSPWTVPNPLAGQAILLGSFCVSLDFGRFAAVTGGSGKGRFRTGWRFLSEAGNGQCEPLLPPSERRGDAYPFGS